jgi:hypothetical protein
MWLQQARNLSLSVPLFVITIDVCLFLPVNGEKTGDLRSSHAGGSRYYSVMKHVTAGRYLNGRNCFQRQTGLLACPRTLASCFLMGGGGGGKKQNV